MDRAHTCMQDYVFTCAMAPVGRGALAPAQEESIHVPKYRRGVSTILFSYFIDREREEKKKSRRWREATAFSLACGLTLRDTTDG